MFREYLPFKNGSAVGVTDSVISPLPERSGVHNTQYNGATLFYFIFNYF